MKALIIDPNPKDIERILEQHFRGVIVVSANRGKEGIEMVATEIPDVVILDVDLPGEDGFEVLSQIHSSSNVPLIVYTYREVKGSRVRGLDLGADDYVSKLVWSQEFLARIKAVMRRCGLKTVNGAYGDLAIDFTNRQVTVAGKEVTLTPHEYKLLYCLVENKGRVVPLKELLTKVWGSKYFETNGEHVLQVNIARLRKKIEADPRNPKMILTRVGMGYMFQNNDT